MAAWLDELFIRQNECSLSWVTKDARPAATVVSFVYHQEKIWMTALAGSYRVNAIRNNPHVAVVISGKGCSVGHSRCVSLQGRCEILSDQATRDVFFPRFAKAVLPDSPKGAQMMAQMMNSPENLVLCMSIDKTIPYDAQQMLDGANHL